MYGLGNNSKDISGIQTNKVVTVILQKIILTGVIILFALYIVILLSVSFLQ